MFCNFPSLFLFRSRFSSRPFLNHYPRRRAFSSRPFLSCRFLFVARSQSSSRRVPFLFNTLAKATSLSCIPRKKMSYSISNVCIAPVLFQRQVGTNGGDQATMDALAVLLVLAPTFFEILDLGSLSICNKTVLYTSTALGWKQFGCRLWRKSEPPLSPQKSRVPRPLPPCQHGWERIPCCLALLILPQLLG